MKNKSGNKHEILLGLTTTPASDWRGKVEEMKKFGIKRIALFPTFLEIDQRKELYKLLEDIEGLEIPHVHLRHQDFEKWEMEMFEQKYGSEVFNIHANVKIQDALTGFKSKIFIENDFEKMDENQIKDFAGICLDTEHLDRAKTQAPNVNLQITDLLKKYPVGCCHVSPKRKLKNIFRRVLKGAWRHYLLSIDEMDYVLQYSEYFPQYISLELENSFAEQMKVKTYLEKLLNL